MDYLDYLVQFNELLKRLPEGSAQVDKLILSAPWSHHARHALEQFAAWEGEMAAWEQGHNRDVEDLQSMGLRPTARDLERLGRDESYYDQAYFDAQRKQLTDAVSQKRLEIVREDSAEEREWLRGSFRDASPETRKFISKRLSELEKVEPLEIKYSVAISPEQGTT